MSSHSQSEMQRLADENSALKKRVAELEAVNNNTTTKPTSDKAQVATTAQSQQSQSHQRTFGEGHLTKNQIERYSRQMLLPDVGAKGTRALLNSTVLVVGAGGLGATAIPYLAAAGVGKIIIVDFDTVDESNLHRQVIHNESRIHMQKALSAKMTAESINSKIIVEAVCEPFSVDNAQDLCKRADVVIDASDNVACRYLVNDAAVMEGKPLVSGCATRWEGQLTVYNCVGTSSPPQTPQQVEAGLSPQRPFTFKGPCYRCLFPIPTPVSSVGSCNEVGVVGPIPGTIGCLQALEAIKVILLTAKLREREREVEEEAEVAFRGGDNVSKPPSHAPINIDLLVGRMLLFDGLRSAYKTIRIRGQHPTCAICNAANRHFDSLKDAFYNKKLFGEYVSGVACELPDSEKRVDALVVIPSASSASSANNAAEGCTPIDDLPTTLTAKYGIVCREGNVTELKHSIDAAAEKSSVIVIDVRPGPQQAMFTLTAENSSNDALTANLKSIVNLITIDTDTMQRDAEKHVDTVMKAVKEAATANTSTHPNSSSKRLLGNEKRSRDGSHASGGDENVPPPAVPIHFICRRGNKSRKAIYSMVPLIAERLEKERKEEMEKVQQSDESSSTTGGNPSASDACPPTVELVNIIGGLTYWARDVDGGFPVI